MRQFLFTEVESTLFLGDVIHQWIEHHFFRAKRAKCLVLIGPTGVGKTSFAFSLPGRVNYFKGEWNLDKWTDYARYSIYDDIPWDEFKDRTFPEKKDLLTQNGPLGVCINNIVISSTLNSTALCRFFVD